MATPAVSLLPLPISISTPPSRDSMTFTSTKGLLNGPGQNNCFLNSAVQVSNHNSKVCDFCALSRIFEGTNTDVWGQGQDHLRIVYKYIVNISGKSFVTFFEKQPAEWSCKFVFRKVWWIWTNDFCQYLRILTPTFPELESLNKI